MLLAALAGEHILFIGPPGTAKSELGRCLASLCTGSFFERLLTRFSVPEVCPRAYMTLPGRQRWLARADQAQSQCQRLLVTVPAMHVEAPALCHMQSLRVSCFPWKQAI